MTRLHNDANMLAMGAGIVGENLAMDIVDTFIDTPFSAEERHMRRVNMIEK
jgi:ribose 5-phosphate isomerase B